MAKKDNKYTDKSNKSVLALVEKNYHFILHDIYTNITFHYIILICCSNFYFYYYFLFYFTLIYIFWWKLTKNFTIKTLPDLWFLKVEWV